jgi:hypothetical protein
MAPKKEPKAAAAAEAPGKKRAPNRLIVDDSTKVRAFLSSFFPFKI